MLIFKRPSETEFRQVKRLAQALQMTNDALQPEQFTILKSDEKLLAFGAVRTLDNYAELECIGVAEGCRGKGWGKMIVKKILEAGPETIWLATDMPKYFEQFNFVPSKQVPRELAKKIGPPEDITKPPSGKVRLKAMVFSKKK
jgi:N-acetylglutamate synthase-like GNAT family acetyltransferase